MNCQRPFLAFVAVTVGTAWCYGIEYNVGLDAAQEVPPPTLNGSTPAGMATVDVNTITGDVNVGGTFAGLTSNAAAAHLHGLAPTGTATGVLFGLTIDTATSGNFSGSGALGAAELAGLLDGQTYLNIHSANNGPGEIRSQVVDADISVFNVLLDAAQEVPLPNLGGATPSGAATVVVDTSNGQIEVSGAYSGMTSDVAAAHLHGLAPSGAATGVLVPLNVTGGTSGSFSGIGTLGQDDLNGFLAGLTYLNIHTASNGAGEIRGQVVPEPSTGVYLAMGVLWLLGYGRRRC